MGYIGVISYNPLILTIDPNFQRDIQVAQVSRFGPKNPSRQTLAVSPIF